MSPIQTPSPHFMISRSLGPEFGGAVGLLFYLGTTFASAMYILGAIEILITYISQWPSTALLGNDIIDDFTKDPGRSAMFMNMRIFGSFLLVVMASIVFIGVKYVNKFASFFLMCVIVSILTVYMGFARFLFTDTSTEVCLNGQRLLPMYEKSQLFRNGSLNCQKEIYQNAGVFDYTISDGNTTTKATEAYFDANPVISWPVMKGFFQGYGALNSDPKHVPTTSFITTQPGQGVKEEQYQKDDARDTKPEETYWITQEFTTFTGFVALFFPSVTGIMAGSNRSGDLADPSRSIPVGTISAIATTSFVYLTTVVFLGGCVDPVLLRDKFGASIGGGMVLSKVTFPTHYIMLFGALLSTIFGFL